MIRVHTDGRPTDGRPYHLNDSSDQGYEVFWRYEALIALSLVSWALSSAEP